MKPLVLTVDDDPSVTASLALLLKHAGYSSHAVASPAEALDWLAGAQCDLVLQDMNFSRHTSGEEGLALLEQIKALRGRLPVVLMTAWGSIPLAVEGMKRGAADFVTKPWTNTQLLHAVSTVLGLAGTAKTEGGLPTREELDGECDFGDLVGEDPRLLEVLRGVARVAATDASVLVLGESGAGKELIAEAIHRNSRRRAGPFVKVNLGGVPATLFEAEMFGHVKGAFTDARQDRRGRFDLADGGTIFLDEIGELDALCQVKLLRVLQDRLFEPLGTSLPRAVDLRVVSASNRDLHAMVGEGTFREDLLYRLNLITLRVGPLRERAGDIPLLARHFLERANQIHGRSRRLTGSAMEALRARAWPGNVRELDHAIERAVLMATTDDLMAADFAPPQDGGKAEPGLPPVGSMRLDEIEKAMVERALSHCQGNVSRAANALGLSRAALYRRIARHGIKT